VREGETLETIATRVLGNPLRFWEIADLNPQIKFPLDIATGTVLRLPL
jgi:nucleoid-associated protein YgaU